MKIEKIYFAMLIFSLGFLMITGILTGCKRTGNDNTKNYFEKAFNYYNSNDFNNALTLFKKVPRKSPNYRRALLMMGKSLFFLKRYEEGKGILEATLRKYPDDPEALYWLGKAYYFSGGYENAKKSLARVVKMDGYNIDALYLLGELYMREGSYDRALVYFNRVISYSDLFLLSRLRKAQMFLEEGQKEKAYAELVFIKDCMSLYSEGVKKLAAELLSRCGIN